MKRPDIIVRVVFELHFRGKERVSQMQNRISAFAGSRFHNVMTRGLAGEAEDRLLVFDRVEFAIGEISASRLEDELARGIENCLRRWLLNIKPLCAHPLLLSSPQAESNHGENMNPSGMRPATMFDAAQTGQNLSPRLPGRGESGPSFINGLNAAVANALRKPADWSEFLAALRDNQPLRGRLADEVSPKLLRNLVHALVPAEGSRIADCAEALLRLHERTPLLEVNIHVFRRGLWECILSELARSQTSHLDLRSLIRSVIIRMATRFSSSYSAIATNVALAMQGLSPRTSIIELLASVTAELKAERNSSPSDSPGPLVVGPVAAAPASGPAIAGTSRRLDDLARFLEWGVLPWSLAGQRAETEMLGGLASAPEEVCALVRNLSKMEHVRKRLAIQFSEKANHRLLAALAPTAAHWISAYMRQLRRLHAQKPLFRMYNREFAQELWQLCFEYLDQRDWLNLDPRSFLRYLLTRLAVRRKIGYENLLTELALRRGPERNASGKASEVAAGFGPILLGLLDETLFQLPEHGTEAPRDLIQPKYRDVYSDEDVLAYWLRWRKLPPWSQATDPEDTGRRLGLLLRKLPAEIRSYTRRDSTRAQTASGQDSHSATAAQSSQAAQIQHWLTFGIWPETVSAPSDSQLAAWLENQSDDDWVKALGGAEEKAIARINHHLPPSLFERIVRLAAGQVAGPVLSCILSLDLAGRRIAPVATKVWTEQLKKYALMYLLGTASVSGRKVISLLEMMRNTMLALALNCRVSYERLLDETERNSSGAEEMLGLCRKLREELEESRRSVIGVEAYATSAHEPEATAQDDPVELVLHYLKHGSLPENASDLTFSALQQLAERFSDQQMTTLARACCAGAVPSVGSARRVAALFSAKSFLRFAKPLFASTGFVPELENALSALASRFSVSPGPLVVAGRIFLLRQPRSAATGTPSESVMEAVLAELIPEISKRIGVQPDVIWHEWSLIASNGTMADTNGPGFLKNVPLPSAWIHRYPTQASARAGDPYRDESFGFEIPMMRDQDNLAEGPRSASEPLDADTHRDDSSADDLRGRLAALRHFLRTGRVPWWAETLAQQPSQAWIATHLTESPQLVLEMLRSLSAEPGVPKRLLRYVGKPELEQMVRVAAPEYGGLIILYLYVADDLAESHDAGLSRSSGVHWRETLAFLLQEQPASEALRELIARVTRSLAVPPETYTASLLRIARRQSGDSSGYSVLINMLEQLLPSVSPETPGRIEPGVTDRDATQNLVSDASHALKGELAAQKNTLESYKSPSASDIRAEISHGSENDSVQRPSTAGSNDANTIEAGEEPRLPTDALKKLDYLLRYGEWPESIPEMDQEALITQVAEEFKQSPMECRRYLLKIIGRDLERKRLARVLPVRLLMNLWPLLLPAHHTDATLCLEVLDETLSLSSSRARDESCRQILFEELLHTIAEFQTRRWDGAAYLRRVVERLAEHLSLHPAALVKRFRATLEHKPHAEQLKLQAMIDRVELETAAVPMLHRRHATESKRPPRTNAREKITRKITEGEPFYVSNAGMVLLWPFLQQYFQKLGLLEKNAFRDERSQNRATYLLQYLTTGILDAPEHQLLLNKILTGTGLEQALEYPSPLTEAEEALSVQLLQGILQNWQKLQNTSIQGLRGSFLVREGKLLCKGKDDAWVLTVSAKGYDILLDSLPWRFSLVKLPWMTTVLHVKWR